MRLKVFIFIQLILIPLFIGCNNQLIERRESIQQENTLDPIFNEYPIKVKQNEELPIQEAIDFWNKSLGVKVYEMSDDGIEIMRVDSLNEGEIGNASFLNVKCEIKVTISEWHIIAHELGHCIGFGHTDDKNSIMYFIPSANEELNDDYRQMFLDYFQTL